MSRPQTHTHTKEDAAFVPMDVTELEDDLEDETVIDEPPEADEVISLGGTCPVFVLR